MEKASFKDFIDSLWKAKWILVISILAVLLVGLLLYWIVPNEYVSTVDVTPTESDQTTSGGTIGNLANLAGLKSLDQQGGINVSLYDAIVSSTPFLKDLIEQKVNYKGDSVYLQAYLSQKMIVGVKGTLKAAFRKHNNSIIPLDTAYKSVNVDSGHPMFLKHLQVVSLTGHQKKAINILRKKITYTVSQDKPIEIAVSLQDPLVSAQAAVLVVKLLSAYVADFRFNKGQSDMAYLQYEADSAKKALYAAQRAFAVAQDQNRGLVSAIPSLTISRLSMKYQMAQSVYSSIMSRISDLQLSLDKQRSAFVIIEPPQVLGIDHPSAPRLSIYIILSLVLGVLLGIAIIICKNFLKINL